MRSCSSSRIVRDAAGGTAGDGLRLAERELYANDGVAGGRRILPEGWVGLLVVAPAERLVVVRLGRSQDWSTFDIRGLIRLVADVNAALNGAR